MSDRFLSSRAKRKHYSLKRRVPFSVLKNLRKKRREKALSGSNPKHPWNRVAAVANKVGKDASVEYRIEKFVEWCKEMGIVLHANVSSLQVQLCCHTVCH